jgi:hypothetical protein
MICLLAFLNQKIVIPEIKQGTKNNKKERGSRRRRTKDMERSSKRIRI